MKTKFEITLIILTLIFASCNDDEEMMTSMPKDPDTAEKASIDRFSSDA